MATYADKLKIARVQLPNGTEYALIDQDLREMVALPFNASSAYLAGDYVINPTDDSLYRFVQNKEAGAWSSASVEKVQVGSEFKRLSSLIAGGIHYRGKTTSPLYDGATSGTPESDFPTILINGAAYAPESGDLVILGLNTTSYSNYTDLIGRPLQEHLYFYNVESGVTTYYYVIADITAQENTSLAAIGNKINIVSKNLEFLFDGEVWSTLGLVDNGLGDLAYRDTASGTYIKPTGSGTVTVPVVTATGKDLVTGSVRGVKAAPVTASKASAQTAVSVAKVGTAVRYGTANVGTAVTYGNADVGTTINNVAISTEPTKTFTTEGIVVTGPVSASSDLLVFSTSSTDSVKGITSTQSVVPAATSAKTLTPAVAAPSNQTLTPAEANGSITPYTFDDVDVPVMDDATTTIATGAVQNGSQLSVVTVSSTTATVTVGTVADTVTVK